MAESKHDLIFFEKRSTPKILKSGERFDAPESYGKQTKRRPATEDEERQIARGDWVRVDEKGTKGGQPGYKKTRMAGRQHLLKHADDRSDSLVVVALPSDEDAVHEFSSEKAAHLTLLYLGPITENTDLDNILNFVGKKISSLPPFTLNVEKRGVLGDNNADVVFFEDTSEMKQIRDLRAELLSSDDILVAYKSVEQYPNWHPHLTLGYPEKPAKSQEALDQVTFDKISVWMTDSDGPTFDLKKGSLMAHAQLVLETDGYIAHYGIPGMRWGRRRTESQLSTATAAAEKAKEAGASDDAIVRAQTEGKLRAGGVGSLSNQEIQTLITRVNLEKQYAQAFPPPTPERSKKAKVKDWAVDLLINEGQKQVKETLNLVTTKKRNDYLRSRDLMETKGDKKKGSDGVEASKKDKDKSKKDRESILDPNQPTPKKSKKEKKQAPAYSWGPDANPNFVPKRETEDLVYKITTL